MLCERIPPPAFRLWCILRSMQFESGPNLMMPPLTIDEVCWLMPGVNGKPTSAARAREALNCLMKEGFLKDISDPGLGKGAARTYLALDEPDKPEVWKDARGKLRAYVKSWRGK